MNWKPFKLSYIAKGLDKTKAYMLCHQDTEDPRCDCNGCYYHCVWWSKDFNDWTNGHGIYDEGDFLWFQWYCEIEQPKDK